VRLVDERLEVLWHVAERELGGKSHAGRLRHAELLEETHELEVGLVARLQLLHPRLAELHLGARTSSTVPEPTAWRALARSSWSWAAETSVSCRRMRACCSRTFRYCC
jgi:hypothetical protein